jgi:hypothetical protein
LAALVAAALGCGVVPSAAASAKDCIVLMDTETEDALIYRNDCNRTVDFYYCVINPDGIDVTPCRRFLAGTRRVHLQSPNEHYFFTQEMAPRSSYEIKLWGGSKIKWAACDAELGGLEAFQPRGNAALDFSYECAE